MTSPTGPSTIAKKFRIAENSEMPKAVNYMVSDTDLGVIEGATRLYPLRIDQQITRMLSMGLLGAKREKTRVNGMEHNHHG